MHRRHTWLARSVLLVSAPLLGLFLVAGQAGASAAPAARGAGSARAAALAVLKHLLIGQQGTNHLVGHAPVIPGLKSVQSTNWSGYADDNTNGNTYSKVTGKWTEPAVSCTSTTSLAVFWVGIDGFSSNTVEQDGTLAECSGGSASYFTWWEMFPTNSIQVVGSSVAPGDKIVSKVIRSSSTYTLTVTDSTHPANSFSTKQTCSNCANSSAEWIAEAPSGSGGIFPLANFGKWRLHGATVTSGGTAGVISTFPDDKITMVNSSGQVKAQPGALNSTGNAFTVTWKRAS